MLMRLGPVANRLFLLLLALPCLLPAQTAVTLSSSASPSIYGAPVVLTASVTPATATGKVTFYDGVTILGIKSLVSGTASLSTIALPAGNRKLKAYFAGVTSNVVVQTVNARPVAAFSAVPQPSIPVGFFFTPMVADFNGDGHADLALYVNGLEILLGDGAGNFQLAHTTTIQAGSPSYSATGDFNGDGIIDFAALYSTQLSILLGNGDGSFQTPINITIPHGDGIVVGDFNGDGIADLAIADVSRGVDILLGKGDGNFQAPVSYPAGTPNVNAYQNIVVADFNGDGRADLATFQSVLLGNGDGTFRTPLPIVDTNTAFGLLVGDFNGDGKPDLATRAFSLNTTDILLGNGDGTFQPAVNYQTTNFFGDTNVPSGVRDFNGDGIDDIIFSPLGLPSEPNVLLGKGDGTFQTLTNDPFGFSGYYMVAGEFTGDGRTDFAMIDSGLVILVGTSVTVTAAGGTIQSAVSGSPFPSPLQVLVKDGNTPLSGVTVTFTLPTFSGTAQLSSSTAITNANGVASVTATAGSRIGNYTVTATALGITSPAQFQLNNLSGAASRLIGNPTTTQSAQVGTPFPQPLRITLLDPASVGVSGVTVTFSVPSSGASAVLSSSTVTTGVFGDATVMATANNIAGSYNITASYGGLTATFPMINLQSESVILASSPNPSTFGAPVALTATLTNPSGTGTISFYSDGATLLGSRPVSNDGAASISSILLPAGVHKLTAVYSGDPAVAGASSNAVTQTVRAVPGGNFLFQNPVTLPAVPSSALVADFNGDGKADFAFSDNATDPNPWWQVDLGTPQTVSSVVVWNRTDCCGSRLSDYWVFVSNTPFLPTDTPATLQSRAGTFTSHQTSAPSPSATIATGGVQGQYVRVQLSNSDYLSLAEVQVFGATGGANLALGKAASQSSTYQGFPPVGAAAAVDGNTDGNFSDGSVSITDVTVAGVTVVLGNGDGTFRPAVTYRTGQTSTSSAAVTDFNGDGIPDLAVAGITGFVSSPAESLTILLGNGDGTFRAPVNYPGAQMNAAASTQFGPLAAGTVGSMVAGDFNGDGYPDVLINSVFYYLIPCGGDAIGNCYIGLGSSPQVVLIPGKGDGTFGPATLFSVPSVPFLVADFNGNGKFDLVGNSEIILDGGTGFHVLSVGTPTFAADFNGDGKMDLAAGTTTLLGNGDGTFQAPQNLPDGHVAALQGDFNGDGIIDIAVTNGAALNGIVYGNGDGTFRVANLVNGGVPLAVADFNGDGRADILTANPSGVTLLLGSSGTPVTETAVGGTPQSTVTGAPFAQPLQVKVTSNGSPVVGASVAFAAPFSGPSATLSSNTAQTDASGLASITASANSVTGSYLVTASSQGVSATFSLTNTTPIPASIAVLGGSPQSTTLGGAFPNPLQVIVKDAAGRPLGGATVNFAAPSGGASAALSSTTVVTNSAGAASVTATANNIAGSYSVTAGVASLSTQFSLTNLAGQSSNVALGRPATQSSTYPGAPAAAAAVDGNTDGNYFDGSVTATNLDGNPWWQVDLGASTAITSVVIFNRTDCCGSRLSDYWVFISDTPFLANDTPASLQNRAATFASHQNAAPNPSAIIPAVTQGRYVRIQLSSSNNLSLAEVEVFGTGGGAPPPTNLSQNKFASQSSTLPGFSSTVAASAVDGNTDGGFYDGSVTATNFETNPWWQVDLGGSASVSSIVIWNRTDCCSSRLGDYWVFVSDTPFLPTDTPATLQNRAGTFASHQTAAPSPSATVTLPSQGRYVRVQLSGTDYLSLAEVQVMGSGAPTLSNLARGKTATQSSPYDTMHDLASAAVDGNTDGNFYNGSVSVTGFQSNPWWQVDLGASSFVNSIVIWNRTDCCGSRLSDYWVFVSDTPFQASDTPATLQNRAGTFASHQTSPPSPSVNIQVGVQGRYVRVQLSGSDYLSLAEVQVYGQ